MAEQDFEELLRLFNLGIDGGCPGDAQRAVDPRSQTVKVIQFKESKLSAVAKI